MNREEGKGGGEGRAMTERRTCSGAVLDFLRPEVVLRVLLEELGRLSTSSVGMSEREREDRSEGGRGESGA